jgi:hypothetical protein
MKKLSDEILRLAMDAKFASFGDPKQADLEHELANLVFDHAHEIITSLKFWENLGIGSNRNRVRKEAEAYQ